MKKYIVFELWYKRGGYIEKELCYLGDSLEEIGKSIEDHVNAVTEYLKSEDDNGVKSFCFQGFSFKKAGLMAFNYRDPDF